MTAGIMIGFLLGAILQNTQYCTMGALSDYFLFKSWRRLRVWILAAAVALIGTQLLVAFGKIDLSATSYLAGGLRPFAMLFGGFLFGWGMVLAGGCVSRSITRAAQGSLKGLTALLVLMLTAAAVASGPLAFLPSIFDLGIRLENMPGAWPLWPMGMAAVIAAGACIAMQIRARQWTETATALGLGGIAVAAWPLSMHFAGQAEPAPASINLIAGTSHWLLWVVIAKVPNFAGGLLIGAFGGAFAFAVMTQRFRIESFHAKDDMLRHLGGAILMGIGGATIAGDTLGLGVAGIAALSIGSTLAVAGMVIGVRFGLAQLEAGSIGAAIKRNTSATARQNP